MSSSVVPNGGISAQRPKFALCGRKLAQAGVTPSAAMTDHALPDGAGDDEATAAQAAAARPLRALNEAPYPSCRWRPEQPAVVEAVPPAHVEIPKRGLARVQVVVRIKTGDSVAGDGGCLLRPERWDSGTVTVGRTKAGVSTPPPTSFSGFAAVLQPGGSQSECYQRAVGGAMLDAFLSGTDCALLAYGQTGSGKSFTMFGDSGESPRPSSTTASNCVYSYRTPDHWCSIRDDAASR